MEALGRHIVFLKEIGDGPETFDFRLDNAFFSQMENDEVRGGDVAATVVAKRIGDDFEIAFTARGEVIVPCNRCLGDLAHRVEVDETIFVRFGEEFSENEADDFVIVPEAEGTLDAGWFLFEFIVLGISIKHVHAPGDCDEQTYGRLKEVMILKEGESSDEDFEEFAREEQKASDPRWDGLKKIINN